MFGRGLNPLVSPRLAVCFNDLRIIYGVQPPLSPLSGGKRIPPDLEEHQSPPVKGDLGGYSIRGSWITEEVSVTDHGDSYECFA